jgi:HD-GYP domain-containing protein (c-di-GMP phosphodiesterase class II)
MSTEKAIIVSGDQSWVIQTEDLQIGTSLSFDLTDATGQVLHKAGSPITERLKERLRKKNIHSVTVRGKAPSETEDAEGVLLDSYPEDTLESIQQSMQNAQQSIIKLIRALEENRVENKLDELNASIQQFVTSASNDIAATLATLAIRSRVTSPEILERIASRSTKVALMAVATSVIRRDDASESAEIGLAGMLHDCSLMMHPEWFDQKPNFRDELFLEEYRRHPIESAELLQGTGDLSKGVMTMITQVHEQADGSGYPRGMKLEQVHSGVPVLNLADAYFTLTEPYFGSGIVAGDALAYLCYHTAQGKFCKKTLQFMIQGLSIYPVGSVVRLDDESLAVVIEGHQGEPLRPTVRVITGNKPRIDLRNSKRSIVSPHLATGNANIERIKKSQMQEILWRSDRA